MCPSPESQASYIDLDAVLNEEASQRDVYESTTKVQRMFLATIVMFNTIP